MEFPVPRLWMVTIRETRPRHRGQLVMIALRSVAVLAMCLLLLLATPSIMAQPGTSSSTLEPRAALVIGNSAYAASPLKNPTNDATDVANALREFGFRVVLMTDADQHAMRQALREFGRELKRGGIGLFYFAGHGVQSKGRNFLVPVGVNIESEAELEDQAVDANLVLGYMEDAANRVNIVILDACRNNPFARSFRSASRGLAQMDAARGSFLAFATAPGSVASDGTAATVFTPSDCSKA
ncbi:MAG: caspase family protein [Betaproteobacteria bacterium]|nr:caspase family protein [Betaproteobacteria bacterium]